MPPFATGFLLGAICAVLICLFHILSHDRRLRAIVAKQIDEAYARGRRRGQTETSHPRNFDATIQR